MGSPGAGQRYATLALTNTSGATCHVFGYPGLQLLTTGGGNIPTKPVRNRPPAPTNVLLAPNARATTTLHWGAIPATGDAQSSQCQPTAARLLVTPPDEYDSLNIAWPGGPVCEQGTIDFPPFTAS
jgi:hypothetical protein